MEENIKIQLNFLKRLYGVLFASLIILLLFASIMVSNYGPLLSPNPPLFENLKTVAIAVAGIFLAIAFIYPQRQIGKISNTFSLAEKIDLYRKPIIIRLILITDAGIVSSLIFLLTADTNLMLILAIILILFILARPTPFKIASDLKLSEEEKTTILN